jgi:methyltransferase
MPVTVTWPRASTTRHEDGNELGVLMAHDAASSAVAIAAATVVAVLLMMLGEAVLSAHNERLLRARGAIEPPDDVIDTMRWAYPGSFVAMAVEGAWAGPASADALAAGLAVFGFAKALKIWAISTLGTRWTFRVLVLPNAPLIARGPYARLRHPNYVAVMGEIIGMALIVWAPVTGVLSLVGFGWLLRRRMAVEDRALGRQ